MPTLGSTMAAAMGVATMTGALGAVALDAYRADRSSGQHRDWVMLTWVSIGPGSQTTFAATEKQCRALLKAVNDTSDPLVVRCIGPAGEFAETVSVSERIARGPKVLHVRPVDPAVKSGI